MNNNKNWLQLFAPSWVVNVIGIAFAVLLTTVVMIISRFQGSELRQQIFEGSTAVSPGSSTYENITNNIADNGFLGAAPLLITWAFVGLVVYYFAISIARSVGQAVELRDELEFVHISRQQMLRESLISLGVRALAVLGLFIFLQFSMNMFIPYAFSAAYIASEALTIQNVGYALLAAAILYMNVYVYAVFLRLIVLRPRVFTK